VSEKTWTVLDALTWTAQAFRERGIPSPRLEAELLLGRATGLERVQLYTMYDRPLTPEERETFRALIKRRAAGEPTQYILARQEFWSLELAVTSDVLIPRGDTEVLVEEVLDHVRRAGRAQVRIVDVGTGSGAIAIALAHDLPDATVLAIDKSAKALEVARSNAERHALSERIAFVCGDLLAALSTRPASVDVVVSNPPYIPTEQIPTLMPEVAAHEPMMALDGGPDGLALIRPLIAQAGAALRPGGLLALEVGDGEQARAVQGLLAATGEWGSSRIRKDYKGLDRVVLAVRAGGDL
jgi:release factor glutamine methyltransferase